MNITARRASETISGILNKALERAWPSYLLIGLLQLKSIWNIWKYRDLTPGDTSYYFVDAWRWVDHFGVSILWSPIYTAFYGTNLITIGDVYGATILHRCIIIILATLGVLAVMRTVLSPALALAVTAWWAILPINFDTRYEVHLFGLLPVLAAWLAVGKCPTAYGRGIALAFFVAGTVLLRNELSVATALFGLYCLIREYFDSRATKSVDHRYYLAAYGAPMAIVVGLCLFFYWRSDHTFAQLSAIGKSKHTLNMCQVYAFGYQQRHPEWSLSPWTQCSELMQSEFGNPTPTLGEMFRANPRAVLQHFLWNISLVPSGIELLLFNARSGAINPDYLPSSQKEIAVFALIGVLVLIGIAAIALMKHWQFWWRDWFRQRADIWVAFGIMLLVAIPIILTQRPRPSYLFATSLVLMAMTATSIQVLARERAAAINRLIPLLVVCAIILVPSHFKPQSPDRPLLAAYRDLAPYSDDIKTQNGKIYLGNELGGELQNYTLLDRGGRRLSYWSGSLPTDLPKDQDLGDFLNSQGVTVLYMRTNLLNQLKVLPGASKFLDDPEAAGWYLRAWGDGATPWRLLFRGKAPWRP